MQGDSSVLQLQAHFGILRARRKYRLELTLPESILSLRLADRSEAPLGADTMQVMSHLALSCPDAGRGGSSPLRLWVGFEARDEGPFEAELRLAASSSSSSASSADLQVVLRIEAKVMTKVQGKPAPRPGLVRVQSLRNLEALLGSEERFEDSDSASSSDA